MESPPLDEGIVVYQTRHGLLCHHAHDQLIGRSLRLYGEWAEEEIYLLSSLIPSGGVVLDLGANIGTHALAFGRLVGPDGYVLAIDAQEEAFRLLVLNLGLNDLAQVHSLRAVLGQQSSLQFLPVVRRWEGSNLAISNFSSPDHLKGDETSVRLPVPHLCVDDLNLPRCDLIKIDVEAMELEVLSGATATMERHRPAIYFEQTSARNFTQIYGLFAAANYCLFWHAADPFNLANYRGQPTNIFGGAKELNILALAAEKMSRWRAPLATTLRRIESAAYDPPLRDAPCRWSLPANAYPESDRDSSLMKSLWQTPSAVTTKASKCSWWKKYRSR
ncbi:MAG: FkbM family methyltransferase [Verrucomicrobiota bacterium]